MANEPQKNQKWQPQGGWQAPQNKNALIIAGTLLVLIGIYFATRGNTQTGVQNPTSTENSSTESTTSTTEENKGEIAGENTDTPKDTTPDAMSKDTPKNITTPKTGNFSVSGTLRTSNDQAKGNLMLETASGNVYVQTMRDFSSLMNTEVTLNGNGNVVAFTLDNIVGKNTTTAMTDTTAKGGDTDSALTSGNVKFTGKLDKSDNSAKGNYTVTGSKTKVYLVSSQDYSAWIGSEVNLTAEGTLENFTGAVITKK